MKHVQSDFIVKGRWDTNEYYITKNEDKSYNIYQVFHKLNKDKTAKDVKRYVIPNLKHLPDEEVVVSFANEPYNSFLLHYHVNINEMNLFRIRLDSETILKYDKPSE